MVDFCRNRTYPTEARSTEQNSYNPALRNLLWLVLASVMLLGIGGYTSSASPLTQLHVFQNTGGVSPNGGLVQIGTAFYGTTYHSGEGTISDYGTVYKVNMDGSGYTALHAFTDSEGADPAAGLIAGGTTLYGTTSGGPATSGSVFKINADGTGFTILHTFGPGNSDGVSPTTRLALIGSTLFGTTSSGGSGGGGTVFKVNVDGTGYGVLHDFPSAPSGFNAYSALETDGTVLYGASSVGGASNTGMVFKINADGTGYSVLASLGGAGGSPHPDLVIVGSVLYGAADFLYRLNTDGTGYTVLQDFNGIPGGSGPTGLVVSGSTIYGVAASGGNADQGLVFTIQTDGTNYEPLHAFTSADGGDPYGSLLLVGSVLYGTTSQGGSQPNNGVLFKINTDGTGYTLLHPFGNPNGEQPNGGLVESNGVFYGTTLSGGFYNDGTVFKVNADGSGFSTLYSFTGPDGMIPSTQLTLVGATLYGTTFIGTGDSASGTVFKINTDGSGFATLHQFNDFSDGAKPSAPLLYVNGALYGLASADGPNSSGTLFKLNLDGSGFQVLHSFGYPEGENPGEALTFGNGVLYGSTGSGGTTGYGIAFKVNLDGSGYTILHNFDFATTGRSSGSFVLVDNTLYGETGGNGGGTVFRLNTDGTGFTILHTFDSGFDAAEGYDPAGGLTLAGNTLYGAATESASNTGTLFSMNLDGSGYRTLYAFQGYSDGQTPVGPLILNGSILYGTTVDTGGFDSQGGVVFALDLSQDGISSADDVAVFKDGRSAVLWTTTDNKMMLQYFSTPAASPIASPVYGPYADSGVNWHATKIKAAADTSLRMLWTRNDGAMGLWTLIEYGVASQVGPTYGPFSDSQGTWNAIGVGVAGDGTSRVLWKRSDGAVGVWTFDSSDKATQVGPVYGPYPDWNPVGIGVASDGTSQVLWSQTDGAAGLWTLSSADTIETVGSVYGPFFDDRGLWNATGIGSVNQNLVNVLWRRSDGAAGIWSFDTADKAAVVGSVYGPYSDAGSAWSASALDTDASGKPQLLWTRADHAAGLWSFGANDLESVIGAVYGPY